jgi:charged multivesicular body protein 2A
MGQIFGKEKPLKEVMRENKRMITRAVRELDREKLALEREEKRLTMEIKKAAKEGQMSSVKIMAKVCVHIAVVEIITRTGIHTFLNSRFLPV